MEDLRKDYNVQKKKQSNIDISKWWTSNRSLLQFIILVSVILFICIRPDIIGHYVGYWINTLYTSFSEVVDIPSDTWYLFLITIGSFAVIYKIFSFNPGKKQ